jgi:transposase InsO family protein
MKPTELLQEIRKMRFEEAYESWNAGRLTQGEAARILGMCERNFRRYLARYEAEGLEGLIDRRLEQISNRRAPVDEVMALTQQYRSQHTGWNVKHFHSWYRRVGGVRSYTWVKKRLQEAELVPKAEKRGAHRKRRERSALPGMMIHQDGSDHEWVAGQRWDLIVTLDDATSEHYSMFFVSEEGTASSLQGVRDVIVARGLFSSFYSDRGSQYCSNDFQDAMGKWQMRSSMSRKGNCCDNAPTESFWGRLKTASLYGKTFATRRAAMDAVLDWMAFYNHRRLHSTLGYLSPMQFEQRWHAAQCKKAA